MIRMRDKKEREREERNSGKRGKKGKAKIREDVIIDVHRLESRCERLNVILGQMGKKLQNQN